MDKELLAHHIMDTYKPKRGKRLKSLKKLGFLASLILVLGVLYNFRLEIASFFNF